MEENNEIIEKFIKALGSDDAVGRVIRTHNYIEDQLNGLLEILFPYPQHIKRANLNYFQKVHLVLCLGGLQDQYSELLLAIGTMRNKFAHKSNMELTKVMVANLYKTLSPFHKKVLQDSIKEANKALPEKDRMSEYKNQSPGDQFKVISVTVHKLLMSATMKIEAETREIP